MKIGRVDIGERETWAVLDLAGGVARPLPGPVDAWGPVLLDDPGRAADVLNLGAALALDEVQLLPPSSRWVGCSGSA